jgi:hypothetical protein
MRKLHVVIASTLLVAGLSGCGAGMSASDQRICDFVGNYPTELLVPTDMGDLNEYMSLTGQEKFEARRADAWYVHDQWEANVDTASGLKLMADNNTDDRIAGLLADIGFALATTVTDGEAYMLADVPNSLQQAKLSAVLAAEAKATGLYKDIALRCVELEK